MAGLLDQIAKDLYAGFKNKLLKGTLKRVAADDAAGLDTLGDPRDTATTEWPCQGFVDSYSDKFRPKDGVPSTDAKVCIFAKSLPAGVRPEKDDVVAMPTGGASYQLGDDIKTDPATALWECRGTLLQASTSGDCRARGV